MYALHLVLSDVVQDGALEWIQQVGGVALGRRGRATGSPRGFLADAALQDVEVGGDAQPAVCIDPALAVEWHAVHALDVSPSLRAVVAADAVEDALGAALGAGRGVDLRQSRLLLSAAARQGEQDGDREPDAHRHILPAAPPAQRNCPEMKRDPIRKVDAPVRLRRQHRGLERDQVHVRRLAAYAV